jgi:hypothetical protein
MAPRRRDLTPLVTAGLAKGGRSRVLVGIPGDLTPLVTADLAKGGRLRVLAIWGDLDHLTPEA